MRQNVDKAGSVSELSRVELVAENLALRSQLKFTEVRLCCATIRSTDWRQLKLPICRVPLTGDN